MFITMNRNQLVRFTCYTNQRSEPVVLTNLQYPLCILTVQASHAWVGFQPTSGPLCTTNELICRLLLLI